MWLRLNDTGHWDGEIWNRRKDGTIYPEWISISTVRNENGAIINYIAIFTDITERKAAEDRIRHLAQYDFLTDLPNRALLFDRLTREFFEARRYNKRFAVLFIDLDKFKPVNDQYGHAVGDLLLREVARRLAGNVRDSDTVSRQGGDEFIILVPELPEIEQVVQLGLKLLRILDEPHLIDGHTLHVTPSIGIAVYPDDGEDVDTLMKNADTAMYRAKNAGRNNLQCYGAELNALVHILSTGFSFP
jgi:diguanylate cyclase (GGDEF)-like protein